MSLESRSHISQQLEGSSIRSNKEMQSPKKGNSWLVNLGMAAVVSSPFVGAATLAKIEIDRAHSTDADWLDARAERRAEHRRTWIRQEARKAMIEGRPWTGHRLIEATSLRSFFLADRHDATDVRRERSTVRLGADLARYDAMLDRFKQNLEQEGAGIPSPTAVQRALEDAFHHVQVIPVAEGSPIQPLREPIISPNSLALLATALIQDAGLEGAGIRIYQPNAHDLNQGVHIESTLRVRYAGGREIEYGLQMGRPVGTNGIYIRAQDVAEGLGLDDTSETTGDYVMNAIPNIQPQTEEEARPLPAGVRTILPFRQELRPGTPSVEVAWQQEAQARTPERMRARVEVVVGEALRLARAYPPGVRYTREDWTRAARLAEEMNQVFAESMASVGMNEPGYALQERERWIFQLRGIHGVLDTQIKAQQALVRDEMARRSRQ